MINKPSAILFDLDDTLISFDGVTGQAWQKCANNFINKHKPHFSKEDLLDKIYEKRRWYWSDPVRHKIGRENIRTSRREVVTYALNDLNIFDTKLINELADNYTDYHNSLICLLPNTIDVLNKIKSLGIRMGLITNGSSDGQRAKLERFSLAGYFEFILIDQELGFGKPDIKVYNHALKLLQLPSKEVWMVGDNLVWDIRPPKSIGIFSIWHDYKKRGLPENSEIIPDKIITDISQLISWE